MPVVQLHSLVEVRKKWFVLGAEPDSSSRQVELAVVQQIARGATRYRRKWWRGSRRNQQARSCSPAHTVSLLKVIVDVVSDVFSVSINNTPTP